MDARRIDDLARILATTSRRTLLRALALGLAGALTHLFRRHPATAQHDGCVPTGQPCLPDLLCCGVCTADFCAACDPPAIPCDDVCVDPDSDPANCGDCGIACDPGTVCIHGECLPGCGADAECDDGDPCTLERCVEGTCVQQPVPDGTPCATGSLCTENDACVDGVCEGTPVDCDDGNECTDDSCDPTTGCLNDPVPDGTPCQDGVCDSGDCVACREDADCDDGDPCTVDTCEDGSCTNEPVSCPEDETCDSETGDCGPEETPEPRPGECVLTTEIKPGLGIGVEVVAPVAGAVESETLERVPLIVAAADTDQLEQRCICRRGDSERIAAKVIGIMDSVDYEWSILAAGGPPGGELLSTVGPATLYQPPELEIGETATATVQVEITDSRGNDAPAFVTFEIAVSRPEECKYRRTVSFAKVEEEGELVEVTADGPCRPDKHGWNPAPPLAGAVAGGPDVCAGERYVFSASGGDFDTLELVCISADCGAAEGEAELIDEMQYAWSATLGGFPDHGAGAETNSWDTTAVYKAPDDAGDDEITVVIADSGQQAPDAPWVRQFPLTVHRVDLAVEDLAEDAEECPGRLIPLNADDDDDNLTRDADQVGVPGENDLVMITLDKQPRVGTVTLSATRGGQRIKVWGEKTKETEVSLPASFPAADLPKELWLEGVELSEQARDVELTLEDENGCRDVVRLTVIELLLYVGSVDETGRGAVGLKEEILRRVEPGDLFPSSLPRPYVTIEDVDVQNIRRDRSRGLVAYLRVQGFAVFPLADIVPGGEADPARAWIQVADQRPVRVNLRREDEEPTLLRPYAARYRFTFSRNTVPVMPHETPITVSVTDPLSEQVGWASGRIIFEAARYTGEPQSPMPIDQDYGHAWVQGPWHVVEVTDGGRSPNGPFYPVVIRVAGPEDAIFEVDPQAEIFEQLHDLVAYEDWILSGGQSGDDKPGVWVNHGRLNWAEGQVLGAGHVSKRDGFVFIKLKQSLPGADPKTLAEDKLNILNTAERIFRELFDLALQRRERRLRGANPGGTYGPPYVTGSATASPPAGADRFFLVGNWMFDKYKIGGAITMESIKAMTQHKAPPTGFGEPAGIPNGATVVYWDAHAAGHKTLGIRHLIGYYDTQTFNQDTDFSEQTQTVTQILHFNNGLGWYVRGFDQTMGALIGILSDEEMPESQMKTRVLDWLSTSGFLTAGQVESLATARSTFGDASTFDDTVGTSASEGKHEKWKEFIDIAMLSRGFGRRMPSTLDIFTAYDIASFEGFHLFGIDAFNDVIATEAGARWGRLLAITPPNIPNAAGLRQELERHFWGARDSFAEHWVFGRAPHRQARESFFSLMLATDADGKFTRVIATFWQDVLTKDFTARRSRGETNFSGLTDTQIATAATSLATIWRSTLGILLDKNKSALYTASARGSFADQVRDHLAATEGTDWSTPVSGVVNDANDVRSLHQMIEILTLFPWR